MSAFYLGVVVRLVALLNVEVLSSAQSMKTREFMSMKAQNGSILCATSTPDDKMTVRSRLDCYKNCMSAGCLCASGANYRMKDKLCEMYFLHPINFQIVPDCTFYQVRPTARAHSYRDMSEICLTNRSQPPNVFPVRSACGKKATPDSGFCEFLRKFNRKFCRFVYCFHLHVHLCTK